MAYLGFFDMKSKGKSLELVMKVKATGMLLVMPAGWMNRHQQDVIVRNKGEDL